MDKWIQMHAEGNCDLFPFYFFVEPWAKRLKPILGKNIDMLYVIRKSSMRECVKQEQYENIGKILFNKIMKENFFLTIMENTDLHLKKVETYIKTIENKDFSQYSNKELGYEFDHYCELIFDLNAWGMMITLMEYAKSSYISNEMQNYLEKHFEKNKINEPTAGIIGQLSATSQETYLRTQKKERQFK